MTVSPEPLATKADIIAIAGQTTGWFVDFGAGDTREVVCWGLISDYSGGVPMVFNPTTGRLIPAELVKTGYRLIHSTGPAIADAIATLLEKVTTPTVGEVFSLGGFYSRKTVYQIADPGAVYSGKVEGSTDGETWTEFCTLGTSAAQMGSYVQMTIHYVRATIDSISGGAVTVRMAWS